MPPACLSVPQRVSECLSVPQHPLIFCQVICKTTILQAGTSLPKVISILPFSPPPLPIRGALAICALCASVATRVTCECSTSLRLPPFYYAPMRLRPLATSNRRPAPTDRVLTQYPHPPHLLCVLATVPTRVAHSLTDTDGGQPRRLLQQSVS